MPLAVMDQSESTPMSYVQRVIPWILAAVTLVLFLVTMSHSVTIGSLPVVGKITGWDWSPSVNAPVFYLLTLPITFLSTASQLLAMNVLTAILACLTLYNLARTVALLPHDRTRDQRVREQNDFSLLSTPTAWIPPVFAVLVCGLQLSFWEHATAATGEMIDLLMFAYLIRCLLEYRLGENESWMSRFAFIYGISITNNWAMISYFPLFLGAVIWVKGIPFFQGRFLLKTAGLGLLGLSLYCLLPLIVVSQHPGETSFFDYLKLQLGNQKTFLMGIKRSIVLVFSLTSIIPVIAMGVRWPSSFGDTSAAGAMLTNFMFRLIHMVFLAACLWISFDPPFSPRASGVGIPFLSFYYLGALAIGYYSGYALLVFNEAPTRSKSRRHRSSGGGQAVAVICKAVVMLAAVAVPAGLWIKNWGAIQVNNGDLLSRYAQVMIKDISNEKSFLFADDSFRILLAKFGVSHSESHDSSNYTFVDTSALNVGFYQKLIHKQISSNWSSEIGESGIPENINLGTIMNVIAGVYRDNPVFYLHSSFGFYFEFLFPKSSGLVYQLDAFSKDDESPYPPAMTEEAIGKTQSFWTSFDENFKDLKEGIGNEVPVCLFLGGIAGMERNNWGVKLQQHGRLDEAKVAFEQASQYAGEIITPELNLKANTMLQSQQPVEGLIDDAEWHALVNKYRSVDKVVQVNGELDSPRFHFELGAQFFAGGNFRQAAMRFARSVELNPNLGKYWIAKANALVNMGFPAELLSTLSDFKKTSIVLDEAQEAEITRLTALGHYGMGNKYFADQKEEEGNQQFTLAEGLLLEAKKDYPKSEAIVETLAQVYFFTERYDDAIKMCEEHLRINDESVSARQTMAVSQMRAGSFEDAIQTLNRALEIYPDNHIALLNRAISHLQLEQLEEALKDYTALEGKTGINPYAVQYGLAEVARLQNRTADAIKHFEAYLDIAPEGTAEYEKVTNLLSELKAP